MVIAFCLFAIQSAGQNKNITVQLKWWHRFEFAGYYAASIKGYYAKRNLQVVLKAGDKNHSPVQEVLRGRATFGISDCDLLINYAKGQPVVAMGALFQHSPYVIISTPYLNVHSPSDLIGKELMTADNYGWSQMKAMFLKEGIPLDSIHVVPHNWKVSDLNNARVDAITGYNTVEPFSLQKSGVNVSIIDPTNYGIDFYGDVLFTQKSVINNDPGMVEAFKEATMEGWDYAMDHQDEIADYILTLPGVYRQGTTREALLYEAGQMRKLMIPDLVEPGHMNEGRWQYILSVYEKLNLVKPGIKLDDFLYNHEESQLDNIVTNIIYFSIGIIALVLGIVLYSLSLKRAVSNRTRQLEYEIAASNEIREKLMLSEERLDLATEAAGIGIWDWNLQHNTVYLSEMWKRMLGYEPEDISDTLETFFQLIHPDDQAEILTNEALHIDGKLERLQFFCRMRTKSGLYKWILSISRAGYRNEEGRATRLIGIHLDVDDIKKKEIELNQLSQELLVSNKELKQFAYITSHNLRSPVANLLMLLQLFRKDELSEKNKSLFDKTEFSIKQLNQTLDDLNEILSARFNKSERSTEIEFEEVLIEVMQSIGEEIDHSGASITFNFTDAPRIMFSRKSLHSIFLNLITNAIKYAKPGLSPQISIVTTRDKDQVTLKVRDEGIGIDLDKHSKKIFGLYQRFHNVPSGKGLGLYIIKNQVEAQNATIQVDSKPGEGATFTIQFNKISFVDEEIPDKYFIGR